MLANLELQVVLNHDAIAKNHRVVYIMFIEQHIRKIVSNYKTITKY